MRALWVSLLLAGCARPPDDEASDPDPRELEVGPYDATIRWTEHGVPHVEGATLADAGYGLGYAFARADGCILADQITMIRSERARFLGRGDGDVHVDSDFGWLALGVRADAEAGWFELDADLRDTLVAWTAGYDRALAEGELGGGCLDEAWVRPIDHLDLLSWLLALGLNGSGALFVPEIGSGIPPRDVPRPPPPASRTRDLLRQIARPPLGSNGWVIGRDRSASGTGMMLSNTHFPSVGEKRWFESHVTVPGRLDVYGVSLMGVPLVNIGFNADVAWTHTVSYAPRFVAYTLPLDPEDPTRYAYDGGWRSMEPTEYTIEYQASDGTIGTLTRTLYRSHYGPVLNAPLIGWSTTTAMTLRDVNADNLRMIDAWFGMSTARALDELLAAQRETQAIPWVYTLATERGGRVFFGDTSRVPYLSDAALGAWEASVEAGELLPSLFAQFGAIVVDGSDPLFTWVDDPEAVVPGLVPWSRAPLDQRTDYAFNANDSPWLHNAEAPLTGFDERLYGPIRTARSARTRMNARYLAEVGPGTASGEDGRFTLDEVEAAALSMRSSLAEAALPGVVARCADVDAVTFGPAEIVPVALACDVLAAWDGRYDVDARGAVLWRELLASAELDAGDLNASGGGLFAVPFDPDDPLNTPREVVSAVPAVDGIDRDPVLRALGRAVQMLTARGWALDVRLGDVQTRELADGSRVAVPGGQYWEGTIGIAEWDDLATTMAWDPRGRPEPIRDTSGISDAGYLVNDGNSYILAMQWGEAGPEARALLTYGQAWDPASPHATDQPQRYAAGEGLRPVLWRPEDVAAGTLESIVLSLD